MTPKEKAEELVKKYEIQFLSFGDYLPTSKAKQCALIAVDEIILEREVIFAARDIPTGTFWHEVKAEIEAL